MEGRDEGLQDKDHLMEGVDIHPGILPSTTYPSTAHATRHLQVESIGGGRWRHVPPGSSPTTNISLRLQALGYQQPDVRAGLRDGSSRTSLLKYRSEDEEIWEVMQRSAEPLPIRAGEWQCKSTSSSLQSPPVVIRMASGPSHVQSLRRFEPPLGPSAGQNSRPFPYFEMIL